MKLQTGKEIVLAIGDLHCPFEHKDTIPFLKEVDSLIKPTTYVCMGDEIDAHALSDYIHDPDGMSAGMETKEAINKLKEIYKLFPKMKVCHSNHTARPFRRAYKAGIPASFLKSYSEILQAPKGWQWADSWEIDGVVYEHGESYSGEAGARNTAKANMKSSVIGHIHSHAGINYIATQDRLLFGFNVGCLIDNTAYAFTYGKHFKFKPIVGVGVINKGVPSFIPMILDRGGRWTGNIH